MAPQAKNKFYYNHIQKKIFFITMFKMLMKCSSSQMRLPSLIWPHILHVPTLTTRYVQFPEEDNRAIDETCCSFQVGRLADQNTYWQQLQNDKSSLSHQTSKPENLGSLLQLSHMLHQPPSGAWREQTIKYQCLLRLQHIQQPLVRSDQCLSGILAYSLA